MYNEVEAEFVWLACRSRQPAQKLLTRLLMMRLELNGHQHLTNIQLAIIILSVLKPTIK